MQRVKIFITPTPNALKLLRFIDDNISTLNAAGYLFKIEKISKCMDEDTVQMLSKSGITRLPAMKNSANKCFIGIRAIIGALTKDIQTTRQAIQLSAPSATGVDGFWAQELYVQGEDGTLKPRADSDGGEGESAKKDIDRGMAGYEPPAHRTQTQTRSAATAIPVQQTRMPQDNISDDGFNDMDEKMAAAWSDNNPDY